LKWGTENKGFQPLTVRQGEIMIKGENINGDGEAWRVPLHGPSFPFVPEATLCSPTLVGAYYAAHVTIRLVLGGEIRYSEIETVASNLTGSILPPLPLARMNIDLLSLFVAASFLTREPNNVCFTFPRTSKRIWANETILRKASPYFETLLSSEFAEGSPSLPSTTTTLQEAVSPYTYLDSDTESDTVSQTAGKNMEEEERVETFPYKTIKIIDTTYTAYLSVLLWISTKYISFAPLLSSMDPAKGVANFTRRIAITNKQKQMKAGLPTPVSPKSVYRLAHLLEIPDLKSLALSNYKSQLTTWGAFLELYGDVSCTYPEVQEITLNYVVDNWAQVKGSSAVTRVQQKMENGEGNSEMALIGIKLAKRLMERYAPK
jgi:hypothetical protein